MKTDAHTHRFVRGGVAKSVFEVESLGLDEIVYT